MTESREVTAISQGPSTVTVTVAKHPAEKSVDLSTFARLVAHCEEARVLLALTQKYLLDGPVKSRIEAYLSNTI